MKSGQRINAFAITPHNLKLPQILRDLLWDYVRLPYVISRYVTGCNWIRGLVTGQNRTKFVEILTGLDRIALSPCPVPFYRARSVPIKALNIFQIRYKEKSYREKEEK